MSRSVLLGIGLIVSIPALLAAQASTPAPQGDDFLKGVYVIVPGPEGPTIPGLVPPVALRPVHPTYTSEAMRNKIQGDVELQVVILADGTVARARVLKSLDTIYGLDEAALAAAKRWRFEPATLNGEKLAVAANLVLTFRIH